MSRMKLSSIAVLAVFCAIPAFGDETELAKVKSTWADIRTIAMSVEALATDTNVYPNVTFAELQTAIRPKYIENVPTLDAWGNPFFYVGDGKNHYRIVSAGADGKFEERSRELDITQIEPHAKDGVDTDLIFQDGAFIQYPTEAKKK
jgi:hypothetical protein